jgi:YggT family protein
MNLLQGFGFSLLQLVVSVIRIYMWVIIIRALISWVSPDPHNPIVQILVKVTEPVLRPLRRLVPPRKLGGLDLSPLIAILLLVLISQTLVYTFSGPVRY